MKESKIMVDREIESQRRRWGFEHDIKEHGSRGLVEAVRIICDQREPDESGFIGDEWFIGLWHKHKNNPKKRYAIAAALLHAAIECCTYETGRDKKGEGEAKFNKRPPIAKNQHDPNIYKIKMGGKLEKGEGE